MTSPALLLLSLSLLLIFVGCDEPNEPDIPLQPYHVASVYTPPAVAQDVAVDGIYAAVATSAYGAVVLDVSNPSQPSVIFHYQVGEFANCNIVGIDALHHYVSISTDQSDPGDAFPLYDFVTGARISGGSFSGNLVEFEIVAQPDTLQFWATDFTSTDGFVGSRLCRASDSSNWSIQCAFNWQSWIPQNENIRGFGRREDNIFAIAQGEDGIHLHNANTNESLADTFTMGTAYDCAWYGDYVIVADLYRLTVVDASNLTQPRVVASLIIPGGDRLQKIVIDGDYACVLDELDGVYIVNISNPLAPVLVQELSLSEPTSLDAENGKLYVTDAVQGLVIYSR